MSDDFDITLEHKLESKADGRGGVTDVRRIELITGTGRRRRWSSEDKARIVEESLASGVSVSEVARHHGLSPQQLFAWRREARALLPEGRSAVPADLQHLLRNVDQDRADRRRRLSNAHRAFRLVATRQGAHRFV
jgi:transposase-like protein